METRKIPIKIVEGAVPSTDGCEEQFRVIDRRHFRPDSNTVSAPDKVEERRRYPTYVEELMGRVAEAERRLAEKARQIDEEIARVRVRLENDHARRLDLAKQRFFLPFLDVLDNLERALQSAAEGGSTDDLLRGIELTSELFRTRLRAEAIEPIEVLNQPFDPNLSQAIGLVYVTDEEKDGVVIEEVLRGYRLGEILLRPAQVRVGRFQEEKACGTQ